MTLAVTSQRARRWKCTVDTPENVHILESNKVRTILLLDDVTLAVEVVEDGGQIVDVVANLVEHESVEYEENSVGQLENLLGQFQLSRMFERKNRMSSNVFGQLFTRNSRSTGN